MILKKCILPLLVLAITACSSDNSRAVTSGSGAEVDTTVTAIPKVGGWYPVFFKNYDESKLDSIIKGANEGRIANMTVSYDRSTTLANKILTRLKSQKNAPVELQHTALKDGSATFDHTVVVVTVYSK